MDRLQGALQGQRGAQFPQRQVDLLTQKLAHLPLMAGHNQGLAPGAMMQGGNIPKVSALLQEFFDHAQRHAKAPRDILTRAFPLIVSAQNPLPQIHRQCLSFVHGSQSYTGPPKWLYYLLKCSSARIDPMPGEGARHSTRG